MVHEFAERVLNGASDAPRPISMNTVAAIASHSDDEPDEFLFGTQIAYQLNDDAEQLRCVGPDSITHPCASLVFERRGEYFQEKHT